MTYPFVLYKHGMENSCPDPGSNRGPLDLQSNALPTELSRQGLNRALCFYIRIIAMYQNYDKSFQSFSMCLQMVHSIQCNYDFFLSNYHTHDFPTHMYYTYEFSISTHIRDTGWCFSQLIVPIQHSCLHPWSKMTNIKFMKAEEGTAH